MLERENAKYQDAKEQYRMEQGIGQRELCDVVRETRVGEVERVVHDLAEAADRYDLIASRLVSRLSCVTSCAPPVANGLSNPNSGYQTALANHLDGLRGRIRDINCDLESMLERIEL